MTFSKVNYWLYPQNVDNSNILPTKLNNKHGNTLWIIRYYLNVGAKWIGSMFLH